MCHDKEKRRQQYLLTRPQNTINFCDKKVIFNFKTLLVSESLHFHLCNKTTEPWGKSHFMTLNSQ